MSNTV
ncbi:hypothetical protein YPPY07_2142, partial [Yersinia pestis PY-07]